MKKDLYDYYTAGYANCACFAYVPDMDKEQQKAYSAGYRDCMEHKARKEYGEFAREVKK